MAHIHTKAAYSWTTGSRSTFTGRRIFFNQNNFLSYAFPSAIQTGTVSFTAEDGPLFGTLLVFVAWYRASGAFSMSAINFGDQVGTFMQDYTTSTSGLSAYKIINPTTGTGNIYLDFGAYTNNYAHVYAFQTFGNTGDTYALDGSTGTGTSCSNGVATVTYPQDIMYQIVHKAGGDTFNAPTGNTLLVGKNAYSTTFSSMVVINQKMDGNTSPYSTTVTWSTSAAYRSLYGQAEYVR